MKFGAVPLDQATGAVLAHSLAVQGGRIRKGRVLAPRDIRALEQAGYHEVIVARLDPDDLTEDAAAAALAEALVPDPATAGLRLSKPHAGRVNIYSDVIGVVALDVEKVHAINGVDASITLATVAPFARMASGGMVATVKIISYGVARSSLEQAAALATGAITMRPVVFQTASLIVTKSSPDSEEKGHKAIVKRLGSLRMQCDVRYVLHEQSAISEAISNASGEVVLILTASATSDEKDVAPQAVRDAGGHITRFGIPVDPGNLLFLGELGARPVIGLPGCVRSPALNGADWVLERVVCGVRPGPAEMAAMGVGGLLKESPARGMPREPK